MYLALFSDRKDPNAPGSGILPAGQGMRTAVKHPPVNQPPVHIVPPPPTTRDTNLRQIQQLRRQQQRTLNQDRAPTRVPTRETVRSMGTVKTDNTQVSTRIGNQLHAVFSDPQRPVALPVQNVNSVQQTNKAAHNDGVDVAAIVESNIQGNDLRQRLILIQI